MLLSCDPPTYGRSAAGVSTTAATHHPADTSMARPAAASWRTRRASGTGAAQK